jgi:hypothetical protein
MIKSLEHFNKIDLLSTSQVGRVVDNKDPRMLQRVRVFIKGVYEDPDVNKLPWAFPKGDSGLGGKPDSSSFQVPEVGSEVLVTWTGKDVYHPFYSGRRINNLTAPKEPFLEDYPESYGSINSNLEWIKINKAQKYVEFFSKEIGKYIHWDGQGNLFINIPKDLIVNIGGKTYLGINDSFGIKSNGKSVLDSTGGVYLQSGELITMDAPMIHKNSGLFGGGAAEIANLDAMLQQMQSKIQELTQVAEQIKARVDSVKEDIGKKTTES